MLRYLPFALVLLAGCADTPFTDAAPVGADGITFTADQTRYGNGDEAHLTLRNGSDETLTTGVLECAGLERWDGSEWAFSPEGNDRACIELAVVLEPGDSLGGDIQLDVPDGTYRFVLGYPDVATGSFRVE